MPTVQDCEKALRTLAGRLSQVDPGLRDRHEVDRTLSCHVPDLGAAFSGRIEGGVLVGLTARSDPNAQIRVTLSSDDLVALTEGQLNFATAWTTGRVRIDASVFDLLRLRSLL